MKHVDIGELIKSIAYHETSDTVVLSTFKQIPYDCLDEEGKPMLVSSKISKTHLPCHLEVPLN